jgi:hypothetical protein
MGIQSRRNPNVNLASAPARVRDAVGRVLELGDEVVVILDKALMRVAEIRPMLEANAPPGAMMITLVSRVVVVAPRDQGIENLYRLRHQAEIGDGAIPGAGEQQQEQAPPLSSRQQEDPPTDMTNDGDGEGL